MQLTPRQKFTQYVRGQYTDERIVSPFLPDTPEIQAVLIFEGLPNGRMSETGYLVSQLQLYASVHHGRHLQCIGRGCD